MCGLLVLLLVIALVVAWPIYVNRKVSPGRGRWAFRIALSAGLTLPAEYLFWLVVYINTAVNAGQWLCPSPSLDDVPCSFLDLLAALLIAVLTLNVWTLGVFSLVTFAVVLAVVAVIDMLVQRRQRHPGRAGR